MDKIYCVSYSQTGGIGVRYSEPCENFTSAEILAAKIRKEARGYYSVKAVVLDRYYYLIVGPYHIVSKMKG